MTAAGLRATARLAAWTALLLVLGRVILALGQGSLAVPLTSLDDLRRWVDDTPPGDMAVALLRLGALALIGYLLAATALVVVAALVRARPLSAVADRVTPGVLRRLATRGGGIGLALGSLAGAVPVPHGPGGPAPATVAAADAPAAATMTRVPIDPAGTRPLAAGIASDTGGLHSATMIRDSGPDPPSTTMIRADTSPPALPAVDDSAWVVTFGDSFWSIAADVLTAPGGPPPTERDISRYWRRLVDANRAGLVDPGNPDLLVPGQRLTIPPP
jgi:nucleoid-associated protein YgaU